MSDEFARVSYFSLVVKFDQSQAAEVSKLHAKLRQNNIASEVIDVVKTTREVVDTIWKDSWVKNALFVRTGINCVVFVRNDIYLYMYRKAGFVPVRFDDSIKIEVNSLVMGPLLIEKYMSKTDLRVHQLLVDVFKNEVDVFTYLYSIILEHFKVTHDVEGHFHFKIIPSSYDDKAYSGHILPLPIIIAYLEYKGYWKKFFFESYMTGKFASYFDHWVRFNLPGIDTSIQHYLWGWSGLIKFFLLNIQMNEGLDDYVYHQLKMKAIAQHGGVAKDIIAARETGIDGILNNQPVRVSGHYVGAVFGSTNRVKLYVNYVNSIFGNLRYLTDPKYKKKVNLQLKFLEEGVNDEGRITVWHTYNDILVATDVVILACGYTSFDINVAMDAKQYVLTAIQNWVKMEKLAKLLSYPYKIDENAQL
jgi:hypothetical protein